MGKVRGLRSRVHEAAVRPTGEAAPGPTPPAREAASLQASAGGVGGKEWAFMNASVFAGTTIDPSALVQKLDVDARSSASVRRVTYVPHQTSHLRCQGQGCFAQEGEAEAEAREVASEDRSHKAGGAGAQGGAEAQGHGGGRGPAAPARRPARAAGAADGWPAAHPGHFLLLSESRRFSREPGSLPLEVV
ncbi:ribosome biogenesis protein SLX9 homolog isoform X4 [Orcinus orca]|uniref:ribosome biogenesis protein SLX9 homolog isoform X4 n=1 Tax=Orcinus orca TaxID=9733 RepID=UPI002111F79A|nr:ribosome biogenesis protein SLX9 homolog isoform X4 [Orcinus orca]